MLLKLASRVKTVSLSVPPPGTLAKTSAALVRPGTNGCTTPSPTWVLKERRLPSLAVEINNLTVTTIVMLLENCMINLPLPEPRSMVSQALTDTNTLNPRPRSRMGSSAGSCLTRTTNTICPRSAPRSGLSSSRKKDSSELFTVAD